MRALLVLSVVMLIAGCSSVGIAPYNRNFPLVEKGMTQAQVTELIGKPVSAESGPEMSKILYYRLASSLLDSDGSDTREYWVQMMDGKVIGYGERNDSATMMRQARQYAAAWSSAQSITDSANKAADRIVNANNPNRSTVINVQQQTTISQPTVIQPAPQPAQNPPHSDWRKWGKKDN